MYMCIYLRNRKRVACVYGVIMREMLGEYKRSV